MSPIVLVVVKPALSLDFRNQASLLGVVVLLLVYCTHEDAANGQAKDDLHFNGC